MTIAQRFVEMGNQLGIDTSNCKTGNIAEVINALSQEKGGTVANSQNIQLAMMNLTAALNENSENEQSGDNSNDQTQTQEPANNNENQEPNSNESNNGDQNSGW